MRTSGWWGGLRTIDPRDLDMSNMGSWPAVVKAAVGLLIMILILASGDSFYLKDRKARLERQRADEVALKEQFASKAHLAANLERYTEQMQVMEAAFGVMLRQLPSDAEVPGLLEDITRVGQDSRLEFEEIRLLPEVVRSLYVELPIQITVTGAYHDLATFISGVSGLPRIVTLHDFQIGPVAPKAGARLRMNIQARTYRHNDKGV